MPRLKLVIFDCDGVLFDSMEANRRYYNDLRLHCGLPPMDGDELQYVHTHHVMDSVRHLFRHHPEAYEKAEAYRRQLDYTPYLRFMVMEPDLLAFLAFLRPARKTAISTNRTTTMASVLRLFQLEAAFDKVVTAMDVRQPKPHPEALRVILAALGCAVDEAVYIGDSTLDQEHAVGAGMRFVAFRNPDLAADFHVRSFTEAMALPLYA